MERLGLFGGTFDPVHVGHLVAAVSALHQLQLDRVLVVVAGDPWQKEGTVVAPADLRYQMVAAACESVDGLEPSRLEIDRAGATYMIDTVEHLRAPDRELVLILGADAAGRLDTWHRSDDLRTASTLAMVDREGQEAPRPGPEGWRCERVLMPRLDVSSTDLRRRIAAGAPVDFLIPAPAVRVLREHGLYTGSQ